MSLPAESSPALDSGIPILGSRSGGLCYELVTDIDGRFVLLNEGRLSRVYLGRIAFGGGNEVVPFALKIQSDSYHLPSGGGVLTNGDVDDAWRREREDLGRAASANVSRSLPLPVKVSLPVVYCRKVERYFHPVCPETGEILSVCKDDGLLRDCGLSEYSRSLRRYLHGGVAKGRAKVFYQRRGPVERTRAEISIKNETDLVRDWGPLARRDAGAPAPAAGFACAGCAHVAECFPSSNAERSVPAVAHLEWVSFYDFEMIALDLLDMKYNEACDLVGGEDWSKVFDRAANDAAGWGRKARLEGMSGAFQSSNQWMFKDDPSKFGLEVLRLKLMMFSEVLEGVLAIHSKCDRPHFGIIPNNLMAKVLPGNVGMPTRWNFRVQVLDLGSPQRFRSNEIESEHSPDVLQPGSDLTNDAAAKHYVSPMVTERQDATLSLIVKSQTVDGHRVHVELEANTLGAIGGLRQFLAEDRVLVLPSGSNAGLGGFWADIQEIVGGKVRLKARLPGEADPAAWEPKRALTANLHFYKNYGHPVDLYGLGMLLLRTLLVNDAQDMDRVEQWVRVCLNQFAADLGTGGNDGVVRSRLLRIVSNADKLGVCDPANVLFKAEDRARAKVVPRDIWDDILVFAFRLLTQMSGFSYAHTHSPGSPFLLKGVIADLHALLQRLQVETFSADLRNREISQACSDQIMVLQRELLTGPADRDPSQNEALPSGFKIHLRRDDSLAPPIVLGPFDGPQVVIGRRTDCDVPLPGDDQDLIHSVSKQHASIVRGQEGWLISDSSSNGTMVDSLVIPRDVPVDLQPGATIRIPANTEHAFLLRFEPQQARIDQTQLFSRDIRVHETLLALYAKSISLPPEDRRQVIGRALSGYREAMPTSALLRKIEEIRNCCGGASPAPEGYDSELLGKAHRMLAEMARDLLGPQDLATREDVEGFVSLLHRFVTTSSRWLTKALALHRQFDEGFGATAVGSSTTQGYSVLDEGEIYRKVFDWKEAQLRDGGAERWLEGAHERILNMLTGGLRGVQSMLELVRNEIDPTKIEVKARSKGMAFWVNISSRSTLWRTYQEVFHNVIDQGFVIRVLEPEMRKSYAPKS
jgi:hypothetical protein